MLPAPTRESPSLDLTRLVLTPAEVAEVLGKNLNELYGMFQRGEAPFPVRKLGRKWIIPRAPFMQWLEGEQPAPIASGNESAAASAA